MSCFVKPKDSEDSVIADVTYEVFDRKRDTHITKKEKLVFTKYFQTQAKGNSYTYRERVIDFVEKSSVALLPCEISEQLGINKTKICRALFGLETQGKISKSGWIRDDDPHRRERTFDRGWLYYKVLAQLSRRLEKHDVLTGSKQLIYDRIRKTCEVHRHFTRLIDLARNELHMNPKTVAEYM